MRNGELAHRWKCFKEDRAKIQANTRQEINRGVLRLAGGWKKGTEEVRETEDGEVISRFSFSPYSPWNGL